MAFENNFHCSICFENFDPKKRYPVVLPCGHTFVCVCCAKQLTRCMECRQSLFHNSMSPSIVQRQPHTLNLRRSSISARGSSHHQYPGANCAPVSLKKGSMLPMPKNLLLISLMEIADYGGDGTNGVNTEVHHEVATNTLASECGTYVAIAKEGLKVFPSISFDVDDPDETLSEMTRTGDEIDIDTKAKQALKLFKHLPFGGTFDDIDDENNEGVARLFQQLPFHHLDGTSAETDNSVQENATDDSPPLRLVFGQKLQITEVRNGWARLARGKGYIEANSNKIVKVCGPSDNACRIEGTIIAVTKHDQNLRGELKELTEMKSLLKVKLKYAMKKDYHEINPHLMREIANEDSNRLIVSSEFPPNPGTTEERNVTESALQTDASAIATNRDGLQQADDVPPERAQQAPEGHPFDHHFFQRMCLPQLPQTLISILRSMSSDDESPSSPPSAFGLRNAMVSPFREERTTSSSDTALHTAVTHPHPHPVLPINDSNNLWEIDRYGNFRPVRRSPVDFRTGMSNHNALLSGYHSHARGIPKSPSPKKLRMSGHMGLTSTGSFGGRIFAHNSPELSPNAPSPVLLCKSLPETIRENEPVLTRRTSQPIDRNRSDPSHDIGDESSNTDDNGSD